MRASTSVLAVVLSCVASNAHTQGTIQKCVGPDGKVHYQDSPCDGGKKAAGTIQRDPSTADPVALKRAREERERSESLAKARAAEFAAEEARRQKAAEDEARAKEKAEAEDRADARARLLQPPPPVNVYINPPPVVSPAPPPSAPPKK